MDIERELALFKKKFDEQLEFALEKKIRESRKISPWAVRFALDLRNYVMSGGKRLRPALMYFGYLAAGGRNKNAIIPATMSVEFLHACFIIQDDIMDRDDLRHGRETMHRYYEVWAKKNLDLDRDNRYHFGVSQAICLGDVAFEMAYRALADSSFNERLKARALVKMSNIVSSTAMGQMSDVLAENLRFVSEKQVLNILEYKTARYTIFGPLLIGAILAGKSDKYCRMLCNYAVPLGIAFQIRDDILGMFGDKRITGKPVGADLKEGKMTLLIVETLKRCDPGQKDAILKQLGNHKCLRKNLEEARDIIRDTGALAYSETMAEKLATQSKLALEKLPFGRRDKKILSAIADFVIKRNN